MNIHLYYVYALQFLGGSIRSLLVVTSGGRWEWRSSEKERNSCFSRYSFVLF